MFSWLANAWRVPELRKRILFTFLILALYRLGSWVPAPGVDSQTINDYFNGRGGTILGLLSVFSGGALSRFALFALGIMPYVTASSISLLIFASILASAPTGIAAWYNGGTMERLFFPLVAIGIVAAVVFIQEGQRRIPIQYAKRMVGRRQTAGGSTYMPLRVNMAGVIPVIFAAAVMAFPPTIAQFFPKTQGWINAHFSYGSLLYIALEGVLIVVFTYFYTAVQFNPVDQADNLRRYGGYIPGIRPGAPTAQYLHPVLSRLTPPRS